MAGTRFELWSPKAQDGPAPGQLSVEVLWPAPKIGEGAVKVAMAGLLKSIYFHALHQALREEMNRLGKSGQPGWTYRVEDHATGELSIQVSGPVDSVEPLLKVALQSVKETTISEQAFRSIYRSHKNQIKGFRKGSGSKWTGVGVTEEIYAAESLSSAHSMVSRLEAYEKISLQTVRDQHEYLVRAGPVAAYSDAPLPEASTFLDRPGKELSAAKSINVQSSGLLQYDKIRGGSFVGCIDEPMTVYSRFVFGEDSSLRALAYLQVLQPFIHSRFYSSIRRDKGFSYIAQADLRRQHGVTGLQMVVMSSSVSSQELYLEVETFKNDFVEYFREVPEQQVADAIKRIVETYERGIGQNPS